MFKNKKYLLATSAFVLLCGCASYQAANLNPAESGIGIERLNSKSSLPVTVAWKVFDKNDCKQYLDRDVLKYGYVPIQITVYNDSDHSLYLQPNDFNIPLEQGRDVAKKAHTSTIGRVLAYGVPSLIIGPLIVPAIVDGIKSSNANGKLDADYSSKTLAETIVQPHSVFNALVFVRKENFTNTLEIPITDRVTNEKLLFSGVGQSKTGFAVANSKVNSVFPAQEIAEKEAPVAQDLAQ